MPAKLIFFSFTHKSVVFFKQMRGKSSAKQHFWWGECV